MMVSIDVRLVASGASRPMLAAACSGRRQPAAVSLGVSVCGKPSMGAADPRAKNRLARIIHEGFVKNPG